MAQREREREREREGEREKLVELAWCAVTMVTLMSKPTIRIWFEKLLCLHFQTLNSVFFDSKPIKPDEKIRALPDPVIQ